MGILDITSKTDLIRFDIDFIVEKILVPGFGDRIVHDHNKLSRQWRPVVAKSIKRQINTLPISAETHGMSATEAAIKNVIQAFCMRPVIRWKLKYDPKDYKKSHPRTTITALDENFEDIISVTYAKKFTWES